MRAIVVLCVLVISLAADAETIHLKNGRTILADRVRETPSRLEYDVGEDSYAIPKSLVDHVDSFGTAMPAANSSPATTDKSSGDLPAFAPSITPDNGGLIAPIIKDDHVDIAALGSLEKSGDSVSAAKGYLVAGRFEQERAHYDDAQRLFKRALALDPANAAALVHYASVLYQVGNYRQAVDAAQRAVRLAPESADGFAVLGFAQSGSDNSEDAVRAWKRSLELRPDPLIQKYLAKAQRELSAESNFSQKETGHFTLRYEGRQTSEVFRRQIIEALETDYDDLVHELDVTPQDSVPVVLYTGQAFFDVTQAPSWTSAMYDGKMRIPVSGMTSVTPDLARVLKHELAHAFINQESHGRCPQWLHEGIAQMVEPRDASRFGRRLGSSISAQQALPFNLLEASFMHFSTPEAMLAYDESLAAAEYLRDTYGMSDIRRVLERLAQGSSTEAALRATIHSDYRQFETDIGRFLQRKYGE